MGRLVIAGILGLVVLASGCRATVRDDWFGCDGHEDCPPGQRCDMVVGRCMVGPSGDAGPDAPLGDAPMDDAPTSDVPLRDAPLADGMLAPPRVMLVHAAPGVGAANLTVGGEIVTLDAVSFGASSELVTLAAGVHTLGVEGETTTSATLADGTMYAVILRNDVVLRVDVVPLPATGTAFFGAMDGTVFVDTIEETILVDPGEIHTVATLPARLAVGRSPHPAVAIYDTSTWTEVGARLVVLTGAVDEFPQLDRGPRAVVAVPSFTEAQRSVPLYWLVASSSAQLVVCSTDSGASTSFSVPSMMTLGPVTDLPTMVRLTTDVGCSGGVIVSAGAGPRNVLALHDGVGFAINEPTAATAHPYRYVVMNGGSENADVTSLPGVPDVLIGATETTDVATPIDQIQVATDTIGTTAITLPRTRLSMVALDPRGAFISFLAFGLTPGTDPVLVRSGF